MIRMRNGGNALRWLRRKEKKKQAVKAALVFRGGPRACV